jgi:hypothetical protein
MAAKRGKPAQFGLEAGACIVCGQAVRGVPAQPDFMIKAARMVRKLLKAEKHTVVCRAHLADAQNRRAKFEKSRFGYIIMAALFFFFVISIPFIYGKAQLGMVIPGAAGALLIIALAYSQYYPKFASATP